MSITEAIKRNLTFFILYQNQLNFHNKSYHHAKEGDVLSAREWQV